ncbi:MAG: UDP-3-O-(3-hydroxymyristoyl)glucosamine N-acyltransferase [Bacteroidia bacterium]|nr:UDP-3-O-(3-hydroxymyristoyl)glucosamine N-acyltransferase [Bacteroidia bacterium]MDW8158438.1 UDP-3-O-(3-hydroxymyristoyl)glucosamine N-acyltransferase [Bacteroidia bacterium]
MRLATPQTLVSIANLLGVPYVGPAEHLIWGINEIHRVVPGDLTFVDVQKYFKKALNSAATTILINQTIPPPKGKALLISPEPFTHFNFLLNYFNPPSAPHIFHEHKSNVTENDVHFGANVIIGKNVTIGKNTSIGHNVCIGANVKIGENVVIFPNVTIYENTIIGNHVRIQANAVIGSEAFYYKKRPEGRERMLSCGRTILEDYVEIGANTTIDRGVTADTIIGAHTKIDNLVQIGHDTVIGKRCIIAAQVGIAGASNIEDDVILWGQVGVPSDVTIGQNATILAQSGVMSSLEGNKVYFGSPAKEAKRKYRELVVLSKITDLFHKFKNL